MLVSVFTATVTHAQSSSVLLSAGAPSFGGGGSFETLDFSLPSYDQAVSGGDVSKPAPAPTPAPSEDAAAKAAAREEAKRAAEEAKAAKKQAEADAKEAAAKEAAEAEAKKAAAEKAKEERKVNACLLC